MEFSTCHLQNPNFWLHSYKFVSPINVGSGNIWIIERRATTWRGRRGERWNSDFSQKRTFCQITADEFHLVSGLATETKAELTYWDSHILLPAWVKIFVIIESNRWQSVQVQILVQHNHNFQDCLVMSRNVVIITGAGHLDPLNNSTHNVQHYKKLIISCWTDNGSK